MSAADFEVRLGRQLHRWREPGAAELCVALRELLGAAAESVRTIRLQRFQKGVYRLRIGSPAPNHSVILKRHEPAIAQRDRLTLERWLPRLGLEDGCAPLLAAAAERQGLWVWHVYEDLGDETLAVSWSRSSLRAAIDLIAELHTRGARHPLLPEVRRHAPDHGIQFFCTSVRDAIAGLEGLSPDGRCFSAESVSARARLLERLYHLLEDMPQRAQAMADAGGPDTLLHGDLWPQNIFLTSNGEGIRAQLIDWDHVSLGPVSYDLSTFIYRAPAEERTWLLERYREVVEAHGWVLPTNDELDLLCHTAESARCASCIPWPVIALHEGAEWGADQLVEIERWFAALRPPFSAGSP
jgi:thiamine kinase-like enzyme